MFNEGFQDACLAEGKLVSIYYEDIEPIHIVQLFYEIIEVVGECDGALELEEELSQDLLIELVLDQDQETQLVEVGL